VVIGAGGHAKVVIDLLRESEGYHPVGCTDPRPVPAVNGVAWLGDDGILPRLRREGVAHAFVALGDNAARERLAGLLQDLGFGLVNAISRAARLSPAVRLGVGIAAMPGVIVNADAQLDDLCVLNTGALVDHDCRIGRASHVAPGCTLAGNVTVGAGALVGIGARIVNGVSIGARAVVGAGSVVIEDVADGATVVGSPARPARTRLGVVQRSALP